jgi:hypothetical protein
MSTLFESTTISIYWQRDDTVMYYELQYTFTIRECGNMNTVQVDMINDTSIVLNGTDNGVEEDGDYNILLIAVNSTGTSQAPIILNTTKAAGICLNM